MERLRIMIADGDRFVSLSLSAMLQNLGHAVVASVSGGSEAVEGARRLAPDLVVMDIKMNGMDGLEASRRILEHRPLPVVILTEDSWPDLIEQADAIGVAGYIVKPVRQKELEPALTIAYSRFNQLRALKQEVGELKETLRARKLIEQAKGLLMMKEHITEAEAYKRLQHMSRNQNIAMVTIAEAIIMTGSLMNGRPR